MQQDQNNNKDNNTKQDPQKDMNAKDAKDVKNKDNTNKPKAQAPQPNQGDKKAPVPAPAPQPQKQQPQPQPAPQPQKPQQPAVTKKYKDGSFTGSARGYNQSANITVSVTISNDRIKSVSVVSHKEDESLRICLCSSPKRSAFCASFCFCREIGRASCRERV